MTSFVVDTRRSPSARLRPVPLGAVEMHPGFWQPRRQKNAVQALPRLFALLEQHGVLNNFRRTHGAHAGPREGYLFTDSDLYK